MPFLVIYNLSCGVHLNIGYFCHRISFEHARRNKNAEQIENNSELYQVQAVVFGNSFCAIRLFIYGGL